MFDFTEGHTAGLLLGGSGISVLQHVAFIGTLMLFLFGLVMMAVGFILVPRCRQTGEGYNGPFIYVTAGLFLAVIMLFAMLFVGGYGPFSEVGGDRLFGG